MMSTAMTWDDDIKKYIKSGNDILDTHMAMFVPSLTPRLKLRGSSALECSAQLEGFGKYRTLRTRQSNGKRGRQ